MRLDTYTFEELMTCLEEIKNEGHGDLSFPKAIYCLAKEIEKLKESL